jgi:hypothetical protein
MQHEARAGPLDSLIAIDRIADDGVADTVEVYANLMPPAGPRADLDQGEGMQPLKDAELGHAVLASLEIDAHPAGAELPQGLVDLAPIISNDGVNQSQIHFLDGPVFELLAEQPVRLGVAGKDDHAAGLFIKAMDDVESLRPGGAEHLKERLVLPPTVRDRSHSFRLIYSQDILVLV